MVLKPNLTQKKSDSSAISSFLLDNKPYCCCAYSVIHPPPTSPHSFYQAPLILRWGLSRCFSSGQPQLELRQIIPSTCLLLERQQEEKRARETRRGGMRALKKIQERVKAAPLSRNRVVLWGGWPWIMPQLLTTYYEHPVLAGLISPHPTTTPTTIHKMSYSEDGASGFCGWPTSWMTERPGWLSCRMASSAFYDCKSLHVMGIRSRKLEGKKGGRRDEKGDGKRNAF